VLDNLHIVFAAIVAGKRPGIETGFLSLRICEWSVFLVHSR